MPSDDEERAAGKKQAAPQQAQKQNEPRDTSAKADAVRMECD